MKTLKKLLILALALIMSLSVFVGCGDDEGDDGDTPAEHTHTYSTEWSSDDEYHWHECTGTDCSAKNDKAEHSYGSDGKCVCGEEKPAEVVKAEVSNAYVFDVQLLSEDTFKLATDSKADSSVSVSYANSKTAKKLGSTETALSLRLTKDMVGTNTFVYESATTKYTSTVTFNAITDNYYNVDADTQSAGYTITTTAQATNVKFKGVAADDATLSGKITITPTGITFAKDLFAGETMGHNRVEYKVGDTQYIVSVCAVTQSQLDNAITFGVDTAEMSPFLSFISGQTSGKEYAAHRATVIDASTSTVAVNETRNVATTKPFNEVFAAKKRYLISADGETEIENKFVLQIYSNASVYIASEYIIARAAKLATLATNDNAGALDTEGEYLSAKGFYGEDTNYRYCAVSLSDGTICTKNYTPAGQTTEEQASLAFTPWLNQDTEATGIINKKMFDKLVAAKAANYSGDVDNYVVLEIPYCNPGMVRAMYLDDICGAIDARKPESNFISLNSNMSAKKIKETQGVTMTDEQKLDFDKVQLV